MLALLHSALNVNPDGESRQTEGVPFTRYAKDPRAQRAWHEGGDCFAAAAGDFDFFTLCKAQVTLLNGTVTRQGAVLAPAAPPASQPPAQRGGWGEQETQEQWQRALCVCWYPGKRGEGAEKGAQATSPPARASETHCSD